jgi:hypothetical protein
VSLFGELSGTPELLELETVKTRLHRARQLLDEQIGPVLLNTFPFAGRRCQRVIAAMLTALRHCRIVAEPFTAQSILVVERLHRPARLRRAAEAGTIPITSRMLACFRDDAQLRPKFSSIIA